MGMVAYFMEVPRDEYEGATKEIETEKVATLPQKPFWKFWVKRINAPVTKVKNNTPYDKIISSTFDNKSHEIEDIDKSWDMLHRCLNNGVQEPLRQTVAAKAIVGEREFDSEVVTGVQSLSPSDVAEVAIALKKFTDQDLKEMLKKIDPEAYCYSGDFEGDYEYVLQGLNTIRAFYEKASKNSSAVLISIN